MASLKIYDTITKHMLIKVRRCQEELNEWQSDMNVLKIDEVKWREVNDICQLIVQDVNKDIRSWTNCLLMNQMKNFEFKLLELESLSLKLKNKYSFIETSKKII